MPFLDDTEPTIDLGRRIDVPKGFAVTPGADDLSGAPPDAPMWNWASAFRQQSTLAALASSESAFTDNAAEPGFNPWEKIKGTPDEVNYRRLVEARNERKFNAIKADIAQETEDKKRLDAQPWWMNLITEGTAGILSPETLLPGGAFIKGAKGGFSLVRSAASVAAGAAAGTATQETALHSIQQTRTLSESATAIGASVFLGGLLGAGGAALLSKGEWSRAVNAISKDIGGEPIPVHPPEPGDIVPGPTSAGAAANKPNLSLDDLSVAGTVAGRIAELSKWNPGMRILQAQVPEARLAFLQTFENSTYLKMNMQGRTLGASAETLAQDWDGGLLMALKKERDIYDNYVKDGGQLSFSEFQEASGKAMRRNDADPNPHIAQNAQQYRSVVFDPGKNAGIAAKLLPPDVRPVGAQSYFSRLWNRNALIRGEREFKDRATRYILQQSPKWADEFDQETMAKAAKLKDEERTQFLNDRQRERNARFEDVPGTVKGIVDEVFNKMTGKTGEARPEWLPVKARGPLQERTFNVPDEMFEDFLENNIEAVARNYTRVMAVDVELARVHGSPDMEQTLSKISEKYKALREAAETPEAATALDKEETSVLRDLRGLRDGLRHTYPGNPNETNYGRILNNAAKVNYLRTMGEVALASLSETVRPAMVHGLMPYLSSVRQVLTNLDSVRVSVREAQLAGNVTEMVLQHRLGTLAEITDPLSNRHPIEALLDNLTNVASKWNGIRLLTDMQKSISAVTTQNRVLGAVGKYTDVAQKERNYLAFVGIDESMAGRIADQFAEHGEVKGGVRIANTEEWTDPIAVRAYRAAINLDVDSTIVQKSIADVPLLLSSSPTVRAMMQFKGYGLASHQKVLLRGLQEPQARFLGGMLAMTIIGMQATWFKALLGNRTEKLEEFIKNPGWWIAEGWDKAGIVSVPMEISNMVEKFTGFNPLKSPIRAFDEGSAISQKNQNRNPVGSIAGPSAGLLADIASVSGIPNTLYKGDEITQGQKGAIERLVPFSSYLGLRQIIRYGVNPPQN